MGDRSSCSWPSPVQTFAGAREFGEAGTCINYLNRTLDRVSHQPMTLRDSVRISAAGPASLRLDS
jgi:hypothetical protein